MIVIFGGDRRARSWRTRAGRAEVAAVNKELMFLLSFVLILYLTVSVVRRLDNIDSS